MTSDLTLDLGLRYDVQTLTDSRTNFQPRVGFGWHPGGDSRLSVRGGYGMYYTQIQSNLIAGYRAERPRRLHHLHRDAGSARLPDLPDRALPVTFVRERRDTAGAQHHDRRGQARLLHGAVSAVRSGLHPGPELSRRAAQSAVAGRARSASSARSCSGFFAGADYVHQHWSDLVRTVDLNAPSVFDRTAPGQVRTAAQADLTRPILPVTGGVRSINAIMNLGVADYDGLQTDVSYRGEPAAGSRRSATRCRRRRTRPSRTATASDPTTRTSRSSGEQERGPSLLDQRHRAVITFIYNLPLNITAGTVTQLASGRPFNATTGVDNNGDGANNDRPVVNGAVISKSAFLGTGTAGRVAVCRRPAQGARPHGCPASRRVQPVQPREHARPQQYDLRRYRNGLEHVRPVRAGVGDRRPFRPSPTSIRRGCFSSRCASSSEEHRGARGLGVVMGTRVIAVSLPFGGP